MELAYKHNWPETRERMQAYWAGEIIDRPCIAVTAPQQPARPLAPPPNDEVKWADSEYVAQSYDRGHEATYFGGEALPGTSLMVGYCFGYGAPLHYMEQTVWQEPIIEDWDQRPSLDLAEDMPQWQLVQAVVKRCAEVAAGKWMVGYPNIHQPNDHIPLLRGTQRYLMDLIERPEDVKRAQHKLLENLFVIYERLADMHPQQEGSSGWLSLWCPYRRSLTMQSDVSCMLSPAMFEEFVAWELEELSAWLEGSTYHLDGPGALQHLDRLLAVKRLHAIQWTPGTGTPGGLYWLDLYKRIQEGGKGVVIFLPYEEVETAVRELKPEGLFIMTGAPSIDAAEALLERAVEITAGK